jgi:hypothetical protein
MRCLKNKGLLQRVLWLVTRRRKFQSLSCGTHSISKSTCIFVMTITLSLLLEFGNVSSLLKLWHSFLNCSSSLMSPPHEPCVLQAIMFVSPERPFHLPIYAQKMAYVLISSEPTRVPTPRFRGDPRVLK